MRILPILLFCGCIAFTTKAQQKWNLQSIVAYAMANNISVKSNDVQAKIAAVNYRQSRLSQFPTASFSTNSAINSGNNQDPVTFNRTTQTYLSSGFQLQSSADIFNFYSKRNRIAANNYEYQAANAATEKIKNDIALPLPMHTCKFY